MNKFQFGRWKSRHISSSDVFSIHLIPTVIVFLTLMIVIGFSWRTAVKDVQHTRNETVAQRAQFIELTIKQRMDQYENTLLAASGLFRASEVVSREEWRSYAETLDLKNRLPGLVGIGFVEVIQPTDLESYERRIQSEGFASFAITPRRPARDIYTSISYIEPFDEVNQRVFGYDLYSEPIRRAAMDRARDSGQASMSDLVQLRQDAMSAQKPGLLLFQPVYKAGMPTDTVEQRRNAIAGFIYIPFRGAELFGSLFESNEPDFNLEIYDGTEIKEAALLYTQSLNIDEDTFETVRQDEIAIYDQLWTFRYRVGPGIVPAPISSRPQSVAIGGVIFSLVVAAVVYLLLQKRTRALSNKEEYKLQRAKDDMLSLASHQLRTPATGVKQYVGMLLEGFVGRLTGEQRDILTRAYESNERQLRIINEFLYLAKADADRIVISPQKFDLIALVKDIVDGMRSEIKDANHKVKLSFASKKMPVMADPHSSRMIIENLISNAIKYTPQHGRITVTVMRKNEYVHIAVKDSGVGIDQKDYKHLFKQFSRIPNDLTKHTSGSGIGLYLAKYLAQKNGGDILVESIVGAGSTFTAMFKVKNVKNVTATPKKST